jgi:hypothetical protein
VIVEDGSHSKLEERFYCIGRVGDAKAVVGDLAKHLSGENA